MEAWLLIITISIESFKLLFGGDVSVDHTFFHEMGFIYKDMNFYEMCNNCKKLIDVKNTPKINHTFNISFTLD